MPTLIRSFAATLLLLFPLSAFAADNSPDTAPPLSSLAPPPPPPAVQRGLQFLRAEAYRWKETRSCAACHHSAMVVWAFNETKARGYSVDEPALKEISAWEFDNMKANIAVPQAPPRDVINLGAVYGLLSIETTPEIAKDEPFTSGRRAFLQSIVSEQEADGSWGLPLDERAPLGGPVEDIAILSRIALLQSGDDSTTVTACLAKAAQYLADTPVGSRQGRNLRLLMNVREGKPAEELNPVIAAMKAEQNADGGWSQTPEMPSDAYATGQTLYILARSGAAPTDPSLARGVEFLLTTQLEDGSWPMTSRVNAKDTTPITATGAAWALLGLLRASP